MTKARKTKAQRSDDAATEKVKLSPAAAWPFPPRTGPARPAFEPPPQDAAIEPQNVIEAAERKAKRKATKS